MKLENLFFAIGRSELSDKMASYMTDLNVFVVKKLLLFWCFLCCWLRPQSVVLNSAHICLNSVRLHAPISHLFASLPFTSCFIWLLNNPVPTLSQSMLQCEQKNFLRYCLSTATQEPVEDKKAVITHNLLSVV
jgi:hypothetical protein